MTVYVLYSQFTDDPSIIRGIYTTKEKLMAAFNAWNDKYKDWAEIELDETYDGISLN